MASGYFWIAIVITIIGAIMIIAGIIVLERHISSKTAQPWYTYFLLIGGLIIMILGGIWAFVDARKKPKTKTQSTDSFVVVNQPAVQAAPIQAPPAIQPITPVGGNYPTQTITQAAAPTTLAHVPSNVQMQPVYNTPAPIQVQPQPVVFTQTPTVTFAQTPAVSPIPIPQTYSVYPTPTVKSTVPVNYINVPVNA